MTVVLVLVEHLFHAVHHCELKDHAVAATAAVRINYLLKRH